MIAEALYVDEQVVSEQTGWLLKPEGACKGERCVPLPAGSRRDGQVDVRVLSERLRMPLVHDEQRGLWALGPESGGHALTDAEAPDLVLPDLAGQPVALSSLRGRKVLIAAWASW
ncbi:MAG: hypothetical protein M3Z02_07655 [Actinomycetota bacterium]|nr:hypothetical protein [Actinomycetota bacterium]